MRIILISGKGGVGKTTVAAATGLASAGQGRRTLIMSFDMAHSLADAFDLEEAALKSEGPLEIQENLHLQEIDVNAELEREWREIYRFTAVLMTGSGLNEVLSEEIAIMPGMEEMVALMCLNRHIRSQAYDLIIVDCPPTGEALGFLSINGVLDWYARKRLKLDRKLCKIIRPMGFFTETFRDYVPEDNYFTALQRLFEQMDGVDEMLRDPTITTVRLVANPEKMVFQETRRAFMYFCMYGACVDEVVVNRVLPDHLDYFKEWAAGQHKLVTEMEDCFNPVPVTRVPYLDDEVTGIDKLKAFSQQMFADRDPAAFGIQSPAYGFDKESDESYKLHVHMPFAEKQDIDIFRKGEDLIVRVGPFKRNLILPRALMGMQVTGSSLKNDILEVSFIKPPPDQSEEESNERERSETPQAQPF